MSAGQPTPGRFTRRGIVVMGIVVLALLAFGSTTQTWLTVRLPQEAVQTPDLTVAGSDAATPVTAFALVALAAALAVSIAGRIARWVIAVILVLSGTGIALSSLSVASDPASAAEPAIGAAIGVSGLDGARAAATAMPWLAVVAGVLLVLAAAWVVLAGRTWGVNRRYDAGAARPGRAARSPEGGLQPGAPEPSIGDVPPGVVPDTVDGDSVRDSDTDTDTDRDVYTDRGTDRGGYTDRGTDRGGYTDRGTGGARGGRSGASAHADEIDNWDELSRGNDPTR
ncbi:Trp biosynthesis-associated membrane protein [Arthrobacter sp. B1805]|uniref:Trp biosynthesis-associated membrane protein n=1 Tax=Arthrobacter sp. B1805 TaxID=2058892 RepID=UPI000CE3CD57|nr:Trp biosynthesis-associated membrane protein [Arthrobacter sp. B1805]